MPRSCKKNTSEPGHERPSDRISHATPSDGIRRAYRGRRPCRAGRGDQTKQLAKQLKQEISVCLIEKGAEIGAHILSGAVMDPRANPRLQINARNCVHCKTCDIKDPTQNRLGRAARRRRSGVSKHVGTVAMYPIDSA